MKTKSKRYEAAAAKVKLVKAYPLDEAVALVKESATAKFDETVELAIKLSIDPKQVDQAIRGSFSVPNGIGKAVRVDCICRRCFS